MPAILTAATLGYVALGVFIPLFVIALIMLKSIPRAFAVALVFAFGSTIGFVLAALGAGAAVGHAVASETRTAMIVAFTSAGAAAGGAIAVWLLYRSRKKPSI